MLLSGDDLVEMLKTILTTEELAQKYVLTLKNIGRIFSEKFFSRLERRKLLKQIKNSGLKYSCVQELGFKCFRRLWNACFSDSKKWAEFH